MVLLMIVRPKHVEQNKEKYRLFVRIYASCWFIYTLKYDARYTQRHINTLQYDTLYTQRHINTLRYEARYTQRHINTLQYDARYIQR